MVSFDVFHVRVNFNNHIVFDVMYFILFSFSHSPEELMEPKFVFILILFIFET